jgi:Glycosyltransferase sugar-binding region containing DXD motif
LRPAKIHFITGLRRDFGGKPFILAHALAILSARLAHPEHEILVHFEHEPAGPFWAFAKAHVTCVHVSAPTEVFGRPIANYAHAADLLRLRILVEQGGIYFDLDTMVIRRVDDLPVDRVVMGLEVHRDGAPIGLCNAFIAAPPGSAFLRAWLDSYSDFDAGDWNKHSVRRPFELVQQFPALVHVAPQSAFFSPGWDKESLKDLFERCVDVSGAYSMHLWESLSWSYLSSLTVARIACEDTTFNLCARSVLAAFPALADCAPPAGREWHVRIVLDRSSLPVGATDRAPFWYVGFHDADGAEIARCDADHRELRRVLTADGDSVVLERTFVASRRPARWTVWPTDRARRWLGPLSGPVDPTEPADRAAA